MFNLFSDIFTYRDNALRRVDPRIKLAGALLLILAVIMSSLVWLPLAALTLCISGLFLLKFPLRLILLRLAPPLGIAGVLMVLQMLMTGVTPLYSFTVYGWHITATREGAAMGMLLSSRVLASVAVMMLLSSSTPAFQIFHALRWFRAPADWIEVAMLMYRYTFALLDLADDMSSSQRVRLGYDGIRRSVSSIGTLAGAIILRSVDQAYRTEDAMKLRGYTGQMPYGKMPCIRQTDAWALVALLAVTTAFYITFEWGTIFVGRKSVATSCIDQEGGTDFRPTTESHIRYAANEFLRNGLTL